MRSLQKKGSLRYKLRQVNVRICYRKNQMFLINVLSISNNNNLKKKCYSYHTCVIRTQAREGLEKMIRFATRATKNFVPIYIWIHIAAASDGIFKTFIHSFSKNNCISSSKLSLLNCIFNFSKFWIISEAKCFQFEWHFDEFYDPLDTTVLKIWQNKFYWHSANIFAKNPKCGKLGNFFHSSWANFSDKILSSWD